MRLSPLLALSTIAATPLFAEETRHLDSHEHGVSTLELAIDGSVVALNITSPGADIVGFEHVASSHADKDAVEAALNVMMTPENIVAFPEIAECSVMEVEAHLEGDEHDDHDDHDDEEGAAHSAFEMHYTFDCADTDELTEVALPFFDAFENAQEIEATFITQAGAGSAEVERDAPVLDLSGLQ